MKRHPLLQDLSREHHGALKLARAAREAAKLGQAAAVATLAQQVVRSFETGLDPHFRVEEQGVLQQLARAGRHALVQRTLNDHAELRELAKALEVPAAATLLRFAELLAAHVRFEERELFAAAQEEIGAELDSVQRPPEGAASASACRA